MLQFLVLSFCQTHSRSLLNQKRVKYASSAWGSKPSSSSSSSDRVDSRGPLRQHEVATTTSLRPFSTNAEGCTIAKAVATGQFLLLRPVIMRGGLACGHRVSPHGRTVSFVSWRRHPEQREGWSGRQLLCVSDTWSYVGNACERPPASVDPPAGVSTSQNHTTKWTVGLYKSGTGASSTCLLHEGQNGVPLNFRNHVHPKSWNFWTRELGLSSVKRQKSNRPEHAVHHE